MDIYDLSTYLWYHRVYKKLFRCLLLKTDMHGNQFRFPKMDIRLSFEYNFWISEKISSYQLFLFVNDSGIHLNFILLLNASAVWREQAPTGPAQACTHDIVIKCSCPSSQSRACCTGPPAEAPPPASSSWI